VYLTELISLDFERKSFKLQHIYLSTSKLKPKNTFDKFRLRINFNVRNVLTVSLVSMEPTMIRLYAAVS